MFKLYHKTKILQIRGKGVGICGMMFYLSIITTL